MAETLPEVLRYNQPVNLIDSKTYGVTKYSNLTTATNSGTVVKFNLGIVDKSFIVPNTMTLNFSLNLQKNATGVSNTDNYSLAGSGYSCFERIATNAAGQLLDSPGGLPLLSQLQLQASGSTAEINGMLSTQATGGSNLSANIIDGAQDGFASFSLPMICNIFNTHEYLPLFCSEIDVECTVADIIGKYVQSKTAKLPAGFTLSNMTLTYDVMEMATDPFNNWMKQFGPSQQIKILTSSFNHTSGSLVAGTTGEQVITYPGRFHSIKALYVGVASNTDKLGTVNPNLRKAMTFSCNGENYPKNNVDIRSNPMLGYNALVKTYGSMYSSSASTCLRNNNFMVGATAYAPGYKVPHTAAAAFTTSGASNQYYIGLDMERLSSTADGVYNGVTCSTSSTLTFDVAADIGTNRNVDIYTAHDVELVFDNIQKVVTASH